MGGGEGRGGRGRGKFCWVAVGRGEVSLRRGVPSNFKNPNPQQTELEVAVNLMKEGVLEW